MNIKENKLCSTSLIKAITRNRKHCDKVSDNIFKPGYLTLQLDRIGIGEIARVDCVISIITIPFLRLSDIWLVQNCN